MDNSPNDYHAKAATVGGDENIRLGIIICKGGAHMMRLPRLISCNKNRFMKKENFKSFADLAQKRVVKKAPAYQWQELALKVINDLGVPDNKRSSVFRVCKQFAKPIVEKALNDTKELCKTGEKWKYFFKIIDKKPDALDSKKPIVHAAKNTDLPF